ncbi:MAG: alpha/beta hydrolase [Gammaproteobacteria bacterium]|nr:alpha/beta hydrolase [Gammaproteobacteria bacterium]MBU1601461.1 alpha/beta hydrolase [Gammaproteobacteria bacterium]MBU2433656.1 alpha/beta hydrolase [Gammaproteobacteria bacterium]MBU2449806.1 alpha/beta hydrolase [Gammaproteobacteria bacterium]
MKQTVLIVPGYLGSGPAHWQSWMERQLPATRRVAGIDWQRPALGRWTDRVEAAIKRADGPVWLVAHSFGCLAAVMAAALRPERIGGALLVAPADPERFSAQGFRSGDEGSIASWLYDIRLRCPSLLVASTNDPWLNFASAAYWADRWGSRLHSQGAAGHINVDSGFGPWPKGLAMLRALQSAQGSFLVGELAISV